MAFPWKNQGNLREFIKLPREFLKTAKSQGILREWLRQIQVLLLRLLRSFSYVLPTVSRQNHWKDKPFTNSPRVNICNIYLPMVNWWMAGIYPNNGVHFHLMKILMCYVMLCYVMDLKLIDVINVSYMFHRSYLLQIMPAFSKWIVKWKENKKTKDSWFWWSMRPDWLHGDGGWGGQNILPYIIDLLDLREFSGENCPTFIAINRLAVKITRRSLSFECICINSSTCVGETLPAVQTWPW